MYMREGEIERKKLLSLLEQWRLEMIDEKEVHERAEELLEKIGEHYAFPDDDARSIPLEVLVNLDALNHQFITRKDIPAMQSFLLTPHGQELQGWSDWRNYWANIDLEIRRRELQSNLYYCT